MNAQLRNRLLLTLLLALLLVVIATGWYREALANKITIALLLPDDVNLSDARVTAWLDAANEEGLALEPVKASTFLRPFANSSDYAGVILPDSVHTEANALLLSRLTDYVQSGGKLMVVFDAATLRSTTKAYAPGQSRLSALAGIDYALYDRLGKDTMRIDSIISDEASIQSLRIPPGKFISEGIDQPFAMASYLTGVNSYAHFVTRGEYGGRKLLTSADGSLIAGIRNEGQLGGQVLFVNLPLSYLKIRTDGLLLHSFLHYFGADVAGMPTLSTAPEGRGGLVLNLHLDAAPALKALDQLYRSSRIFQQGPYSIHVTAGPDVSLPGDGLGLNVPGNANAQAWLRFFTQRGDQVGSHGGWIHNYFGLNIEHGPRPEFERFLELNKSAIEQVTGHPVSEYSAPIGAQPLWVSDWLDEHGIGSYYFTGNVGMGPTRTYRDDRRPSNRAWAFPIMSLGRYASFEEMFAAGVTDRVVAGWLTANARYVSSTAVVRLVYAHPPGFLHYLPAVDQWLDETQKLARENKFAWYTMTDVADFLNQRERVTWKAVRNGEELHVTAGHPVSLARQAWQLPAGRYGQPTIIKGDATIRKEGTEWLIVDREGNTLEFKAPIIAKKLTKASFE